MSSSLPLPVFVDSDVGCDDAVAIAWLLQQPDITVVGFSTVFGNSSVEHTTNNLLALLEASNLDIPVTSGASAPLVCSATMVGAMIHGLDGMWGAAGMPERRAISNDAPAAIAAAARTYPGLTIIALGPLTNLAHAVQQYPEDLRDIRLVALGGAALGGNVTPTAEFNIFADPHALDVVLRSAMQIELVTLDAFRQVTLDVATVTQFLNGVAPLGVILSQAISAYQAALRDQSSATLAIPDAAAVIYALHSNLGTATPATVRVVLEGEFTRGQTIIASEYRHRVQIGLGIEGFDRLTQVAFAGRPIEPILEAALGRAAINAHVVLSVDGAAMSELLWQGLQRIGHSREFGS